MSAEATFVASGFDSAANSTDGVNDGGGGVPEAADSADWSEAPESFSDAPADVFCNRNNPCDLRYRGEHDENDPKSCAVGSSMSPSVSSSPTSWQ